MIRTATSYDELAPSIIADLEALDRDSTAYADAMEALSVLNSVREAGAHYLTIPGAIRYAAGNTRALAVFATEDEARTWIRGFERPPFGGFAIVKVDRTGSIDAYTALELDDSPEGAPTGAPELERRENVLERVIRENVAAADRFIAAAAPAGPRRFETEEQVERARNLAAYGPLGRRPIDDELDALGWTERYDGDPSSSDLRPDAAAALFDRSGRLTDRFVPIAPAGPLYEIEEYDDEETGAIRYHVTTHRLAAEDEALARRLGIDPRLVGYSVDGEAWYRGAPLIAYG